VKRDPLAQILHLPLIPEHLQELRQLAGLPLAAAPLQACPVAGCHLHHQVGTERRTRAHGRTDDPRARGGTGEVRADSPIETTVAMSKNFLTLTPFDSDNRSRSQTATPTEVL